MAPRRYEMRSRAVAVEQTRQRIVAEAIRLFAEQTAAATSMEDVARAAGVSPATVYRHFGDFEALAEACAQTAFHIAEVPTPEDAVRQFDALPSVEDKLRRFIDISCHCYERAADWLAAERRERHLPAFARTLAREDAALDAIIRGLLQPLGADAVTMAVVKALIDFSFWQLLRSNGVPRSKVGTVMHRLVLDHLTTAGILTGISHTDGETNARKRTRQPRAATRQG